MADLLYAEQREEFTALWATCSPEDREWIANEIKKQEYQNRRLLFRYERAAYRILQHLNSTSGRKFRQIPGNHKGIIRALGEGVAENDIIDMVSNQWKLWSGDTISRQWFRPSTLFGGKFDGYLGQVPRKPAQRLSERVEPAPVPISDDQFIKQRETAREALAQCKKQLWNRT